ncbi:MAG TPA: hypothetical protein PLO16_12660 [Acidocella sp.]|nr:hypothetical protein [Acidocella sp.]
MGAQPLPGVAAAALPPANDRATAVVAGKFTSVGPGFPFALLGQSNIAIWGSSNSILTTTNGSLAASVLSGTGIAAGGAVNSVNVPPGTTWATFSGTAGTLALPTVTYQGVLDSSGKISGLAFTAGLVGAAVTGLNIAPGTTVLSIVTAAVPPIPSQGFAGIPGVVQLSAAPAAIASTPQPQQFAFALTANAISTGVDAAAVFTGAAATFAGTVQLERSFDGGATWLVGNIGGTGTLAQWSAGTPVNLTFGEPEIGVTYRLNCIAYTSGTINYRMSQSGVAASTLNLAAPI